MRTAYRNDEFQQVPEKNNWRDPRRNSWYSTERTTKIIKKGSPLQFPEKKTSWEIPMVSNLRTKPSELSERISNETTLFFRSDHKMSQTRFQ